MTAMHLANVIAPSLSGWRIVSAEAVGRKGRDHLIISVP
jgi:hypothetical protein